MNNDIEKELKELQIQYDKVLKDRNELKKENKLLKKDLKEYQAYIKKGVEEHYKEFMKDYDVLLELYEEFTDNYIKLKEENKNYRRIIKERKKLKEIIKANFGYYPDNKHVFFNYNLPVMEKEILEVLEDE